MTETTKTATLDHAALLAAAQCVDKDETRYYLEGVLIEIRPRDVTYVATNGKIMFAYRDELPSFLPDNTLLGKFIIPAAVVKLAKCRNRSLAHIPPTLTGNGGDPDNRLADARKLTLVLADGTSHGFEAIDGTFPEWRRVSPKAISGNSEHGYDPALLLRLWKAGEIIGCKDPTLYRNGDEPALVSYFGKEAFGLIMPKRGVSGAAMVPTWGVA